MGCPKKSYTLTYDMMYNQPAMKPTSTIATAIHLITGLGALVGGSACIADPYNPIGTPVSMLEGSPFSSFLIPGLVLFIIFGLGNILQIYFVWKQTWWRSLGEGVLGGGMILWIVIQITIIDIIVFLHITFLVIGIIQAAIALRWVIRDHTLQHAGNILQEVRGNP
jgi:hypothetical protein